MKLKITPEMRAKWKQINARRKAEDKPPLNFPLLVKTRNRIDAVPESYQQSVFAAKSKRAPCGTVACLAGEGIIASCPTVQDGIKRLFQLNRKYNGVENEATSLFGFTVAEAAAFDGGAEGWPKKHYERYSEAESTAEEARAAVAYLTSIIRTGKVID